MKIKNWSRLRNLEREILPNEQQPTYISIDVETWESGDFTIDRAVKIYIGISPDDWDIEDETKELITD